MASDRYKHHHQHHSNAYQQQKQQHHHRSRSHHYYHHRDGRKNFQLLKSYNNNYRLIYTHSKYQDFCSERSKSSVFCLISIVSLPSILFVFLLIPNQFDRIESMWIIGRSLLLWEFLLVGVWWEIWYFSILFNLFLISEWIS